MPVISWNFARNVQKECRVKCKKFARENVERKIMGICQNPGSSWKNQVTQHRYFTWYFTRQLSIVLGNRQHHTQTDYTML